MTDILEGYINVVEEEYENDIFRLFKDKEMRDFIGSRQLIGELEFLNGNKVRITIEEDKVTIEKVDD